MARTPSWWGLFRMLHTPMECLRQKGKASASARHGHPSRGQSARGQGWRRVPGSGPWMIYRSLLNTGEPGVLVSQPFNRPSSPPVETQTASGGSTDNGELTGGGDLRLWVNSRGRLSGQRLQVATKQESPRDSTPGVSPVL